VRNVTSNSFEFQIDEWNYLDGIHKAEMVSFVVLESGLHAFEDLQWQADVISGLDHEDTIIHFSRKFNTTPLVFTQIRSAKEHCAVISRTINVNDSSFTLFLQEEENSNNLHSPEQVSYLAIEQGTTWFNRYTIIAESTGSVINHRWHTIDFSGYYTAPPVILASLQSLNEWDPAQLRYTDITSSSVKIFCQEEQSKDFEVNHAYENAGYLLIANNEPKQPLAQATDEAKDDTTQNNTVNYKKDIRLYPNPTSGQLTVELSGFKKTDKITIQVFTVAGKQLLHIKETKNKNEINIYDYPAGTYFVRVITGKETKEYKVIKK
jgi:hypothetical protein